ncbi:MAG TPA: hypothetical protein VMR28_03465 [Candidatus Saccharimonadales bacterium]|nr:hypothetical protein [Candidatus Saccharimonadales bacterium]
MDNLNTASEVLLIIVSSVLSVFLVVAIIAGIKLIQILQSVKRITAKAEKLAESAEAVGDFFRKSAGPVALGKFLTGIADTVIKRRKAKGE